MTLASSNGASTSSNTHIGEGLTRNTANIKESAVKACSPPDKSVIDSPNNLLTIRPHAAINKTGPLIGQYTPLIYNGVKLFKQHVYRAVFFAGHLLDKASVLLVSDVFQEMARNGSPEFRFMGFQLNAVCLDMDLAYSWSLHHLTHDMDFIKSLFPISLFELDSDNHWEELTAKDIQYPETGISDEKADFHKNEIEEKPIIEGNKRLTQLAKVIRSKNAGINEITYDIMFESTEDYQYAINSGKFSGQYLSKVLGFSIDQFIGCYRYDPVNAIKITIHRNGLSGSPGDHDVFGAQQHTNLLQLEI